MIDPMDYYLYDQRMGADVLNYVPKDTNLMSEPYALWLEPDAAYKKATKRLIRTLSLHPFDPHVTLAALVFADRETILRCTESIAARSKAFHLIFEKSGHGPSYFQTAFLQSEPESVPELIALRARAYTLLGAAGCAPSMPERPYLPHMSIAYQPVDSPTRQQVQAEVENGAAAGIISRDLLRGFEARSISVWRTDVNDLTTASWERIGTFPLCEQKQQSAPAKPAARVVRPPQKQVQEGISHVCQRDAGCCCPECLESRRFLDL